MEVVTVHIIIRLMPGHSLSLIVDTYQAKKVSDVDKTSKKDMMGYCVLIVKYKAYGQGE